MAHHFFLSTVAAPGEMVLLEGENAHHAVRVLRLRRGENITLADSGGRGYRARIASVNGDRVAVEVTEPLASTEPSLRVTLLQGWPKGDKLDLIIEKCTELGVARISVLTTERAVPRPDPAAAARRRERWQQKALAAARQSGRHRIPEVSGPLGLLEALAGLAPGSLLLVPWEEERSLGLRDVLARLPAVTEVTLLVGPEGGLSPAEIELIRNYGGRPVTLGPRILRTETAGLACLAAVMYALGDLG
ncbi:16S rRNA (uracil(1498)-N(3))-methyltransferase [Moorella naiadis]|uniref:16S rRNA (uracil(1498)-N(3))-methyltransferase n=1 Tax=Moorella naiadis (nom. illeg.) TaxID=3093670 RepID=UPI003D9CB10E